MTYYPNPLRATARSLAERLEQLTDRLATLGERLREGIAQAIGGTAAEIACSAARSLLKIMMSPTPDWPTWPRKQVESSWDPYEADPWAEEAWSEEMAMEDDPAPPSAPWTNPSRWGLALVAAWQAANGLWSRGRTLSAVLAAGAALAAGLWAAPGGTILAAGAAALAAALALVSAQESTRRILSTLGRWLTPTRQ